MDSSKDSPHGGFSEPALTAKEIAPFIGCAAPTIYGMAAAGQIPYVSVGVRRRGRRFYLSAVRAALESQTLKRDMSNGVRSAV